MVIICTSLLHHILVFTAICIPVQVIIIPLDCNRNTPNINFRSHITLAVNLWLLVHFLYVSIYYSYYNVIALFYRICCTMWMSLYCHSDQIHNSYHHLKRQLSKFPCLHPLRDKHISKVRQYLRPMFNLRRKEGITINNQTNLLNAISILWNIIYYLCMILVHTRDGLLILYAEVKFWLPSTVSCMLGTCLLKCYTGWELTSVLLTVIMILFHCALISYLF